MSGTKHFAPSFPPPKSYKIGRAETAWWKAMYKSKETVSTFATFWWLANQRKVNKAMINEPELKPYL